MATCYSQQAANWGPQLKITVVESAIGTMRKTTLALSTAVLAVMLLIILYTSREDTAGFGIFADSPQEDPPTAAASLTNTPGPNDVPPTTTGNSPSTEASVSETTATGNDNAAELAGEALPTLDISYLAQQPGNEEECFPRRINSVYVPETGHHVNQPFLSYWQALGIDTIGFPISEPVPGKGSTSQYFERGRLDYYSSTDESGPRMRLAALGEWAAQQADNSAFEPMPPNAYPQGETTRYFEQSGHFLRAPFTGFWQENGGRPIFGHPISDQFEEDGELVQYFQGARLEWHEEDQAVLVSEIGRELATDLQVEQAPVERRAGAVDYNWEPSPTSMRIPTLMYHRLGAPESRYQISLWMFEQQLIWLRDNGYRSITMDQAYAAVYRGADLPEKPILITFDDGWAGQWEAAALLDAYGMHGVFFIMPQKIEINHDQVRDLLRRGHEIGSHSVTHPRLTEVSDDELWHEVISSKSMIEEIIGSRVDYFAYPYGDHDERVSNAVAAAGYCGGVRAMRRDGVTWTPDTRWTQPRIEIPGAIDLSTFASLVEGA